MTRHAPPVASLRTLWLRKWLGNSLVGRPPFSRPQTMRQASPASLISTMQMLSWGARGTLRKYLPLPVEMKNSPRRLSAWTPMFTHWPGMALK